MIEGILSAIALVVLLVVSVAILSTLSEGERRHRVGVTLLAAWAGLAITIYALKAGGEPLPSWAWRPWLVPVGALLGAWALWDTSRLARQYGTTTLIDAAEVARGFLLSDRAVAGVWERWAYHLPVPAWVKTSSGALLALNRHCELRYHMPPVGFVGLKDGEVWPTTLADQFSASDREVLETMRPLLCYDPAPTLDQPSRKAWQLKFPVGNRSGKVVGVGGVELTMPEHCHCEHPEDAA